MPACRAALDRLGSAELKNCRLGAGAGWQPEIKTAIRTLTHSCTGIEVDTEAVAGKARTGKAKKKAKRRGRKKIRDADGDL